MKQTDMKTQRTGTARTNVSIALAGLGGLRLCGFAMRTTILSLVLIVAMTLAQMATATPITYSFTGVITRVDSNTLYGVTVGGGFSGSFTIDDTDLTPSDPSSGTYSGGYGLTLDIGSGNVIMFTGAQMGVVNNDFLGADNLSFSTNGGAVSPIDYGTVSVGLVDFTGNALSNDQAPTLVNPASFDPNVFDTYMIKDGLSTGFVGELTSLNGIVAPEPSSMILMGAGLSLLGMRRVRQIF